MDINVWMWRHTHEVPKTWSDEKLIRRIDRIMKNRLFRSQHGYNEKYFMKQCHECLHYAHWLKCQAGSKKYELNPSLSFMFQCHIEENSWKVGEKRPLFGVCSYFENNN